MNDKYITLVESWEKIRAVINKIATSQQEEKLIKEIKQEEILDAINLDEKFDLISLFWSGQTLAIIFDPLDEEMGRVYKIYKNYKKELKMGVTVYSLYTDFNSEIFDNPQCVVEDELNSYVVKDDFRFFSVKQLDENTIFEDYVFDLKQQITNEQTEILNGLEWQDEIIYFKDRRYTLITGFFDIEQQAKMIGYKLIFEGQEEKVFECLYAGYGNYSDITFEAKDTFANLIDFN